MASKYNIVVQPDDSVIEKVKDWKRQLEKKIGFYSSVYSAAHITLNLFTGAETTYEKWRQYVREFAEKTHAFNSIFNRTGYFHNGAFFLRPDAADEKQLISLMKNFHREVPKGAFGASTVPHVSIGRRLQSEQIQQARAIVADYSLSVDIHTLAIRKFDPRKGQYFLAETFPLLPS